MYYGNNPKVQSLLEEIEVETENAEKKAKSKEMKKGISKTLLWILVIFEVFVTMTFGMMIPMVLIILIPVIVFTVMQALGITDKVFHKWFN